MKIKYTIVFAIFFAFLLYKFVNINDLLRQVEEKGMDKCKEFEMDKCIIDQIKYENFLILSTCNQCNCKSNGAQFLYVNLTSSQLDYIIVQNVNVKAGFQGSAMSIFQNRIFIVNELNNTIASFDIEMLQGHLSFYFKFEIKQKKDFKLGYIHALSEYEILATTQNTTSQSNPMIRIVSDLVSPQNKSSFIQYFAHSPRTGKTNTQLVDGIDDATTLTGIIKTKHNKFIVGSPDEKSIRIYQYFWYQGIAMMFTKLNTTYVGFEVGNIQYDDEEDQILIAEYSKTLPQYACWGSLHSINGNQDNNYSNMTSELMFQTKTKICSLSSAINHKGIYYIGTKFANQYIVCQN